MNLLCFQHLWSPTTAQADFQREGGRLFQRWKLWHCFPVLLHSAPAGQVCDTRGVWHLSCSAHPSRALWDPAGCCCSQGSLALPLLFLLGIHPQDLAAMPWFSQILTLRAHLSWNNLSWPFTCKPGGLSFCTAKAGVAFTWADLF